MEKWEYFFENKLQMIDFYVVVIVATATALIQRLLSLRSSQIWLTTSSFDTFNGMTRIFVVVIAAVFCLRIQAKHNYFDFGSSCE